MNKNVCDICLELFKEIKILPISQGSNINVCYGCYRSEMNYRNDISETTGKNVWEFPQWTTLKKYETN